jgi:hypothetical protein
MSHKEFDKYIERLFVSNRPKKESLKELYVCTDLIKSINHLIQKL